MVSFVSRFRAAVGKVISGTPRNGGTAVEANVFSQKLAQSSTDKNAEEFLGAREQKHAGDWEAGQSDICKGDIGKEEACTKNTGNPNNFSNHDYSVPNPMKGSQIPPTLSRNPNYEYGKVKSEANETIGRLQTSRIMPAVEVEEKLNEDRDERVMEARVSMTTGGNGAKGDSGEKSIIRDDPACLDLEPETKRSKIPPTLLPHCNPEFGKVKSGANETIGRLQTSKIMPAVEVEEKLNEDRDERVMEARAIKAAETLPVIHEAQTHTVLLPGSKGVEMPERSNNDYCRPDVAEVNKEAGREHGIPRQYEK